MANYTNYQTVNTTPHPEGKAWCISPKFQKSAQQVAVEMNDGKSYNYACKFPVAEGDVVVIGKQLQKDNIDSAWGVATTGSMGIASDIKPKLEIKRSHAAEIDFVFTQNVDKKLITACSKDLELDTDSGILKSWSSSYIKAIYPISLLIGKLISAASIIAFPEFASKDAIQTARDYICKPQFLDETIWSLTTMYPWYPDVYFCDIHIDVNGKNEEELNAVGVELTDGALPGDDREDTPSGVINQYVNKYVYMGAISIMARGGFVNLLGAFLSANPPISDFLDEIISAIGEHCCPEALALIIAAKDGDLTEENILKMTDAARKSKEVQCANGQIGNDNTHLKKEPSKLEKVKGTEEKKSQNRQENAAKRAEEYAESAEKAAEEWMQKYEKYITHNPVINFNGSVFVSSGCFDEDHPTIQVLLEEGGQYRSKVSGLTNYLVVDPRYAGQSKIEAAIEQLQKGKNIKVVLRNDLENALTESILARITTTSSSTSSTVAIPKATETKVSKSDCEIDYLDTLTAYNGNAKAIILPDGISAIGEGAFLGNENITSVVIPEGVETIEDDAFWMCSNLEIVILPSTIRSIGDDAFRSTMLTCIVIPDGCEELGADCFTDCEMLNDIYVPSSVYLIGEDAFCTFNDATVIHTEEYSTAESTAKENGIKVDYEAAPALSTSSMGETSELADIMSDLTTQVDEMQSQELSNDDRETLSDIIDTLEGMQNDFAEGMGKYGDYLEQKEAREKAREEEKARKMAEAMANGKSEKDIVNMYIILTNEKKLGQLHRSQDNFFEIYEEDFAALSKAEVIQMRKDMLAEMEDESLCSYYAESFRQRSVKDRFTTSTLNLNNVSDEPDFGKKSEFAIENSKEWFTPAEYAEVRKLMDAELADARKQIDEQLRAIEENWMKFNTATEFLQICIEEKSADGSDMQESWSCFQHVIGSALVSIKLSTKGMLKMVTNVMNFYPWYWGVTVRDIWEAARRNEIDDNREGAYNGNQIADQALNYIKGKYNATPEDYEDAMRLATASFKNQVSWAIDRFEKMDAFKYSKEISWCKKRIELLNEKEGLKRQIDDPEYRLSNSHELKEIDGWIKNSESQTKTLNDQIDELNNSILKLGVKSDGKFGAFVHFAAGIVSKEQQTKKENERQMLNKKKETLQAKLAENQAQYEALLKMRKDTTDRIRNTKDSSEMLEIQEKIKLIDEELSKSFEEVMQ